MATKGELFSVPGVMQELNVQITPPQPDWRTVANTIGREEKRLHNIVCQLNQEYGITRFSLSPYFSSASRMLTAEARTRFIRENSDHGIALPLCEYPFGPKPPVFLRPTRQVLDTFNIEADDANRDWFAYGTYMGFTPVVIAGMDASPLIVATELGLALDQAYANKHLFLNGGNNDTLDYELDPRQNKPRALNRILRALAKYKYYFSLKENIFKPEALAREGFMDFYLGRTEPIPYPCFYHIKGLFAPIRYYHDERIDGLSRDWNPTQAYQFLQEIGLRLPDGLKRLVTLRMNSLEICKRDNYAIFDSGEMDRFETQLNVCLNRDELRAYYVGINLAEAIKSRDLLLKAHAAGIRELAVIVDKILGNGSSSKLLNCRTIEEINNFIMTLLRN